MRALRWLLLLLALPAAAALAQERPPAVDGPPALRVCADPDNLPFSHRDGSGFENRIARLVAAELGRPLRYEWLPDRRGFVRKTLGAGLCDLIVGVPEGFERTLNTQPYYRSRYVLVDRRGPEPPPATLADPRLAAMRLGVQLVADDLAATPPGHALASQQLTRNVTGFPVVGEEPSALRMVRALEAGTLDGALVWGPQVGWFARRAAVPLRISAPAAPPGLAMPFEFSIAMGVRRGDTALQSALDAVLQRRGEAIRAILAEHGVPLLPVAAEAPAREPAS